MNTSLHDQPGCADLLAPDVPAQALVFAGNESDRPLGDMVILPDDADFSADVMNPNTSLVAGFLLIGVIAFLFWLL